MFSFSKAVHNILRLSSKISNISKSTEILLLLTLTIKGYALFLTFFSFKSWASSLLLTIWFNRSLDHRDIFIQSGVIKSHIKSKWLIRMIKSSKWILPPHLLTVQPYKLSKGRSAHFISDICTPDFSSIDWSFLIN